MFEKASRMKLRFDTNRGYLCAEDLWDLSLHQLNGIAKGYNKILKESSEEDYLEEETAQDVGTKLQFDIALHILKTKQAEAKALENAAVRKLKKEKLLSIYERKQDAELEGLELEDLKKLIDEV